METSVASSPAARAAFSSLIDYAGLFPPAQLSMAQARDEYLQARTGPYAWMLGRFIIPFTSLAGAAQSFAGPFSAIVDASQVVAVAELRTAGVAIDAIEIPVAGSPDEGALRESLQELRTALDSTGLSELPVYVEFVGRKETIPIESAISAAAAARCGAKLRCGGATAEAFPAIDEVAQFIGAATAARVPFKATAGLHHPVRHFNAPSGFTMHGFLNILAAAALAPRVDLEILSNVVAEEDPETFRFEGTVMRWRDREIGVARLRETREHGFVGYGSCSFAEPVDDLTALGILAKR